MVSSSTVPKLSDDELSSNHNATLPGTEKGVIVIPISSPSVFFKFNWLFSCIDCLNTYLD